MAVYARIKEEGRRNTLVLLGGLGFTKRGWTEIPTSKVEAARTNHSDVLMFSDSPDEIVPPALEKEKAPEKPEPVQSDDAPWIQGTFEDLKDPVEEPEELTKAGDAKKRKKK